MLRTEVDGDRELSGGLFGKRGAQDVLRAQRTMC